MRPSQLLTALALTFTLLGPATAAAGDIGVHVGADWRVMRIGGHTSHGPGFTMAASLLDGHLRLGISGFSRPGPINNAGFGLQLPDGQDYKGQGNVSLRSDGGLVGLMVAPVFRIPGAEFLELELPVTVGQAAFGFYLTGDDRETPDGRRVSEWENELMDGRDAAFALGIETGARLALVLESAPWFRPYIAGYYLFAPGYDAFVRSSYDGASFGLGAQLGVF